MLLPLLLLYFSHLFYFPSQYKPIIAPVTTHNGGNWTCWCRIYESLANQQAGCAEILFCMKLCSPYEISTREHNLYNCNIATNPGEITLLTWLTWPWPNLHPGSSTWLFFSSTDRGNKLIAAGWSIYSNSDKYNIERLDGILHKLNHEWLIINLT